MLIKMSMAVVSWAIAGLIFWMAWFPVRMFLFSMIPATAEYAWVGKLLVTILVAYFGGIVLPLVFVFGGFFFLFHQS